MDRLEELKNKYKSALDAVQKNGVSLSHLHVQDLKFGWTTFALRDLNRSCRGVPLKSKLDDDFASEIIVKLRF